ncbi:MULTISPECIES: CoA transferase subunit A [Virgibacillus]|uniref:Succinyl-CoA:3-ketoacid coenzyme A transferase subunit A n=2 Tax=Virgibacillus TaxID=84406 RepID=A0ABQ2DTP1_9BACI|nr:MULTISPECIES: CoA transferase subunit A [Virgibacillus]EQB38010.1 succinyl-CoA:3-ketoacid-CoA transferase [Virgibacillus sp. CM-4]MYL40728.1 3-oxoacid CoA-transferase subunit A [Virgibacillus massiliensis]GGJ72590.1 putative succinyl-CoA:3-ketoacid coenzyme A transferase subunit A [Virgibacillus kapii]CDQ38479.1 putative succinyl-CoA:3-ketoacid coenzyme A transferase subunit A [Virgibacillus massiliensis]
MNKVINKREIVQLIQDGDTLLVGGFGMSGTPLTLLDEIAASSKQHLTVVSNNLGEVGKGLGKLLTSGCLKKAVGSYFTTNRDAVKAWNDGLLEIDLIPQGTLAEAIRCGGAGIGGFYTKTAVGTKIAEGKEEKVIDGERYLLEKSINGDVSLIKALKADTLGNLIYDHTARNFNPSMATAGKVVIAEVDEIVEAGELSPLDIVTPHAYIDYLVLNKYVKKGGVYVEPIGPYSYSK